MLISIKQPDTLFLFNFNGNYFITEFPALNGGNSPLLAQDSQPVLVFPGDAEFGATFSAVTPIW